MQEQTWNKEYLDSKLVTKDPKPQTFLVKALRAHKKSSGTDYADWHVLDLGSGTGRNANYLAEKEARVVGIEISVEANRIASERAKELGLGNVEYLHQSIGDAYPFENDTFDVILDITSSNSLNEAERHMYLTETHRVLKPGGAFFVRALCLDGDKNAQYLIKNNPGPEHHTYVMPETGIVERVFTKEEFEQLYSAYFEIEMIEVTTTYTRFEGQSYKRKFLFAKMKKKLL